MTAASGRRWARLHVHNSKRSRSAEDVEVLATSLADVWGEPMAPLSGRSLGWTHFSEDEEFNQPRTRINIPPGIARPVDLLVFDSTGSPWPRLCLVPNPSHLDRYVLKEGRYIAQFALTARDTPATSVSVTIDVGADGEVNVVSNAD